MYFIRNRPLYYLLRIFVWLGLKIFCRTIQVNRPELFKTKGPLLLASNHPNAFLDAIILGSLFHEPVHFLARGDVFRRPLIRKMLTALHLIPIYRLTEGKENLGRNEASFVRCQDILASGGIVLIFAEGLSFNQWVLRPMKKGTARIAMTAMNEAGPSSAVRILPVCLNYNSFESLSKTLLIHFGDTITRADLSTASPETKKILQFNGLLAGQLSAGLLLSASQTRIIQTLISNHRQQTLPFLKSVQAKLNAGCDPEIFEKLKMPGALASGRASLLLHILLTILLFVPAVIGWLLHIPLYFPLKKIVQRKTNGNGFFDSIMFCALVITYPAYWLFLNILLQPFLKKEWFGLVLLLMPLLGWITVYWKENALRVRNYFILSAGERKVLAIP